MVMGRPSLRASYPFRKQATGLSEDPVKHGPGQATCQRILLAWMVRGEQNEPPCQGEVGPVSKSGAGTGERDAPLPAHL